MSRIKSFISENSINRKVHFGCKNTWHLEFATQFRQHSCSHRSCMSSENILFWNLFTPDVIIPYWTVTSLFMNLLNFFHILLIIYFWFFRIINKKSIMFISCWMLLGYIKSIKIIKTRFNKLICWHFFKPHL